MRTISAVLLVGLGLVFAAPACKGDSDKEADDDRGAGAGLPRGEGAAGNGAGGREGDDDGRGGDDDDDGGDRDPDFFLDTYTRPPPDVMAECVAGLALLAERCGLTLAPDEPEEFCTVELDYEPRCHDQTLAVMQCAKASPAECADDLFFIDIYGDDCASQNEALDGCYEAVDDEDEAAGAAGAPGGTGGGGGAAGAAGAGGASGAAGAGGAARVSAG